MQKDWTEDSSIPSGTWERQKLQEGKTHHVIATSILLNHHAAVRTVFGVCSHVVGGPGVVTALLQPLLDGLAVRGCMILHATGEAELRTAALTGYAQRSWNLKGVEHPCAMGVGAGTQTGMGLI